MSKLLTKSKYIHGLKCSKMLWLEFNRPEEIPAVDAAMQHRFDQGHLIGEMAKQLYPSGIDIQDEDFSKNIASSKLLLKEGKPLFEPAFIYLDCYARADILNPVEGGKWDIIEVKSSTKVKEDHLYDLSFQKYVYEGAGLKIRKCFLMHIDNTYVKNGEIDAEKLFVRTDVTDEVNELLPGVSKNVQAMWKIINLNKCPEMSVGDYCPDEFGVHANDKFWKENPDCNILDLVRGGEKAAGLFNDGVLRLKDIPASVEVNGKQAIQIECDKTGGIHISERGLKSFAEQLQYPLHFLDFETYATAIPIIDGTKPYQNVPFQFSLWVIENEGAKPVHHGFLFEGKDDPREEFIEALKKAVKDKGSILVYFASFEKGRLNEIAEALPKYSKWISSLMPRVVDLYSPFNSFFYYNPAQKGSTSIKNVLPAVAGKSYEDLEIRGGEAAQIEYLRVMHGEEVDKAEKKKVLTALEEYCKRDTEGMIWILDKLKGMIE